MENDPQGNKLAASAARLRALGKIDYFAKSTLPIAAISSEDLLIGYTDRDAHGEVNILVCPLRDEYLHRYHMPIALFQARTRATDPIPTGTANSQPYS